jgi:ribonuclease-3
VTGLAGLLGRLGPTRRRQVLTHPSWARTRERSYERLEFFGDSVLGLVVSGELFARHPEASEGDLTLMRQRIVSRQACARAARTAGLPEAMGAAAPPGERRAAEALARRQSVQAALAEALMGAAWLDLGPDVAAGAVLEAFAPEIAAARPGERDPKTALQEEAARRRLRVAYRLTGASGPAHARTFRTEALVGGEPLGSGRGSSKQASEQAAAAVALARLRDDAGVAEPAEREAAPC